MSSTWKKVLLSGADITSADFAGNKGDLVQGKGIALTGTLEETLLGASGDNVTIAVDIAGQTDLGESPQTNDLILVHDTSAVAGSQIKKVSISNLSATFDSGVSSLQLKGTSGTTGTADTGAVVFQINGGTGISTVASDDADDGKIVINAAVATDSTKGIATFDETDFDVDAGDVTIKNNAIKTALITDSAVTNDKLAGSITDAKLSNITSSNKVALSALNIAGGTAQGELADGDLFTVRNIDGGGGSGQNGTVTIQAINTYVGGNAASTATVHTGITGATDIDQTGINFLQDITMDAYGHVTQVSAEPLPSAASGVAGILNNGGTAQTITGDKTFENNITVSGNHTVTGNLTVNGTTTSVNSTEVTINDKVIQLADPTAAYAITNAAAGDAASYADNAGFVVASHHTSASFDDADTDATIIEKYAGVRWRTSGNLTGWHVNDTAAPHDDSAAETTYDADQDVSGSQFAIAIMDFKTDTGAPGSGAASAGPGSFLLNTHDDALYIRVG